MDCFFAHCQYHSYHINLAASHQNREVYSSLPSCTLVFSIEIVLLIWQHLNRIIFILFFLLYCQDHSANIKPIIVDHDLRCVTILGSKSNNTLDYFTVLCESATGRSFICRKPSINMWLYQSFQKCFHTINQKPYIQSEYANCGKYDKKLYSKKWLTFRWNI